MNKAEEFFKQNYHTPMDSFLGKYGVPVLHGIHEDGQEEWEDIPIWKVLEAYHQSRVNAISTEKLLDTYIRKEMTQDECVGFSDGMEEFKNELLKQ